MTKKILIGLTTFFFITGCKNKGFNIYEEMQLSDRDIEKDSIGFLQNVKAHGISFSEDQLTPNLNNGKLFGDFILKPVELKKYFVYSENKTVDHRISIEISLLPKMIQYVKTYVNQKARIDQIENYKPAVIEEEKPQEIQEELIIEIEQPKPSKKVEFNDSLEGLLPPRLPDLSIGVDNPDLPTDNKKNKK